MYTLRYNFISWLVMNGIPLNVVAELSGHSSIEMLDKHYADLMEGEATNASQIFAGLLDGKKA
jgi:intergrase/recombinase